MTRNYVELEEEMNWVKAEEILREEIRLQLLIGVDAFNSLHDLTMPMLKRFDSGERSRELYEDITLRCG